RPRTRRAAGVFVGVRGAGSTEHVTEDAVSTVVGLDLDRNADISTRVRLRTGEAVAEDRTKSPGAPNVVILELRRVVPLQKVPVRVRRVRLKACAHPPVVGHARNDVVVAEHVSAARIRLDDVGTGHDVVLDEHGRRPAELDAVVRPPLAIWGNRRTVDETV